jgi:hypothetical protein
MGPDFSGKGRLGCSVTADGWLDKVIIKCLSRNTRLAVRDILARAVDLVRQTTDGQMDGWMADEEIDE